MRILALDVGSKATGLAISSLDRKIIFPLNKIFLNEFNEDNFFELLKKNLRDFWEEIGVVVIGNGLDFDYFNPISKIIKKVENVIKKLTDWKVISMFESYTSVESKQFLRNLNISKKKVLEKKDSCAALFILQDYFYTLGEQVMISF